MCVLSLNILFFYSGIFYLNVEIILNYFVILIASFSDFLIQELGLFVSSTYSCRRFGEFAS